MEGEARKTPAAMYEAIRGDDEGRGKSGLNGPLREAVEASAQGLAARINAHVARVREESERLTAAAVAARRETNRVERPREAALLTAATRLEAEATDLAKRLKAWSDTLLLEARGVLDTCSRNAKKEAADAKERITEVDLPRLRELVEQGSAPKISSVAPPKGERAILATSSLVWEAEIVDADRIPRELCRPDEAAIRNEVKGGRRDIPGVRCRPAVRIMVPAGSGRIQGAPK